MGRIVVRAALVAASLGLVGSALSGCGAPQPPEQLVELRQAVGGQPLEAGRRAAPDLVAEAERSLSRAEAALHRRDRGAARLHAVLGLIQARTAFAISRQRAAEERLVAARAVLAEAEESLARFRAEREDAEREIERLGALGSGASR